MDFYCVDDHERLIKIERDIRSVEKILNSIQIQDEWLQNYGLQNSMSVKKSMMGRKVIIDNKIEIKEEMKSNFNDQLIQSFMISKKIKKIAKEDTEESVLHLVTTVNDLGMCYATVEFVRSFRRDNTSQAILVLIDLVPCESRMNVIKLILNDLDLKMLFKIQIQEAMKDRPKLIKIFQRVLSTFQVVWKTNYSYLQIPTSSIDSKNLKQSKEVKEFYSNRFEKYKLSSTEGCKLDQFLKKRINETIIMIRKVVKVKDL